jgi:hypothetical protein
MSPAACVLLIVGAYRDGEVTENSALARTLAELNRRRLLVMLPLPPLEAEETRMLAANMLRGAIAPELTDLLHRQGGEDRRAAPHQHLHQNWG